MKKSVIVLLHTGYWIIYILLLALVLSMMFVGSRRTGHIDWLFVCLFMSSFALVPALVGFYSFYTVLFSRLLKRKRIFLFLCASVLVSLCCGLLGACMMSLLHHWHLSPGLFASGYESAVSLTNVMSFNALLNGGMGLVMKGFISWYGDIKLKEDLNRKNYETELALIKSQLNPHFLFNTINNIDVLIGKDPATASLYLNKLSDMMRFMLYETRTEEVLLAKELVYLQKYIDLHKIRTANADYVHYLVDGAPADYRVAPMLFIPFIENAFKHAENRKQDNAINIRITIREDNLIFYCENKYPVLRQTQPDMGGLGNGLIRKRLDLLYPGRHLLDIRDEDNIYTVTLTLFHHAH